MTRDEYESKLAELERQLAELKKAEIEEEKPSPPHPRWEPEEDQYYFRVELGEACPSTWTDAFADRRRYEYGNVFRTEAEAEYAAERMKVLTEMREWAGKWDDEFQIGYSKDFGVVSIYADTSLVVKGDMRFESYDDAKNCIEAVGEDRIKKYYFGVPDDETDA